MLVTVIHRFKSPKILKTLYILFGFLCASSLASNISYCLFFRHSLFPASVSREWQVIGGDDLIWTQRFRVKTGQLVLTVYRTVCKLYYKFHAIVVLAAIHL